MVDRIYLKVNNTQEKSLKGIALVPVQFLINTVRKRGNTLQKAKQCKFLR